VVLPLSMPGVVAGLPARVHPRARVVPVVGPARRRQEILIGNLVQNQFTTARNWPFGSAASFVMMVLVLGAVMIYLRVRDKDQALGAH
jgi:spermidine/putrescine transport system permease protein